MPAAISVMKNDAVLVTLIKPQFEAHRSQVCGSIIFPACVNTFHAPAFWLCLSGYNSDKDK